MRAADTSRYCQAESEPVSSLVGYGALGVGGGGGGR